MSGPAWTQLLPPCIDRLQICSVATLAMVMADPQSPACFVYHVMMPDCVRLLMSCNRPGETETVSQAAAPDVASAPAVAARKRWSLRSPFGARPTSQPAAV
jgi:hypothetical protein